MLKEAFTKLGKLQNKYPILFILLVLIISSFFLYYAARIETDSSFDVMKRDDGQGMILKRMIDHEFGGTDTLFILASIDSEINDKERLHDIRDPSVLNAMVDLKRSLESETFVASTFSLADVLLFVYGKLPETLEESKTMINNLPDEIKKDYVSRFLSEDYVYQNMMVSVSVQSTPGYIQKIEDSVREKVVQTPYPIGVKAELTGMPILMNRIILYLINDNIKTIFLAIIGVIIILWIYFKSIRIALISAIPTILTLTWLAGTMYLLDIRITVMTASVGAMMIGISVDYAIHLTHRFHENVNEGKKGAVEDTVVGIGTALFASVMTTIAGFLAMLLGISPNSQTQGKVLAIGVAYAFIVSILILPPLMKVQRKYLYSKLDETIFKIKGQVKKSKKNIIDKFLLAIAGFQVRRPGLVLIGVVVLTFLIVPGFGLVYMDTEGENWIPKGDDVLLGLENVGYNFGGTESMNLMFMIDRANVEEYDPDSVKDLRDPRVLGPMASLDILVTELKWVNSVDSPTNALRRYNNGRVPKDGETIKNIFEENPDAKSQYNKDYTIALFTPRGDYLDRDQYYELMRELDGVKFPEAVTIVPQGVIPEDIEFEQTMGADTMKTTLVGFILIIIIASLFYRSIVSGLLAFFPIIFAMMWTVGIMGYINLPFTVLTTGMLAILMGMGIDFSIHLIHSVKEKMVEYHDDIEKAIPRALMSTGQAISITTITTVMGFMALSFATLVNTMRLGWTLALGIFATFLSCVLIVPTVLSIQYKYKLKKSKKTKVI
jgi:uncharacterized protein